MKHLVIGPGAMAYFAFAGALSALKDLNALNDLEDISGSSAGSILALLYILAKGDMLRVMEFSINVPVGDLIKPVIKTLIKSFGLVGTRKIRKIFKSLINEFVGHDDVTFAELYTHWPVKLHVAACCIELSTTHYFSVDTAPNMSVVDAITMSISVPFLFAAFKHGPWHYIDGGTLEESPCAPFIGKDSVCVIRMNKWAIETNLKDIKSYAVQIINSAMYLRHKYPNFPTVLVDAENIFDFKVSSDSKIRTFVRAYISCKNTPPRFEKYQSRMPEPEPCIDPSHPLPVYDAAPGSLQIQPGGTVEMMSSLQPCTPPKTEDTDTSEFAECTPEIHSTIEANDSTCLDMPPGLL
jgi:predicted acylesterase/phospholipase RssA